MNAEWFWLWLLMKGKGVLEQDFYDSFFLVLAWFFDSKINDDIHEAVKQLLLKCAEFNI